MPVTIISGGQWGDEGKGKIVDYLSSDADVVARFQGGANAGHTIQIGEKQYILHLVPTGILREHVLCYIGNGVVVDPEELVAELDFLRSEGVDFDRRLIISRNAHLVTPLHKLQDKSAESGTDSIGTTLRGIGPAYTDKYSRVGIRVADVLDERELKEKFRRKFTRVKELINRTTGESLDFDNLYEPFAEKAHSLIPFIGDVTARINEDIAADKNILLEGAQGALLDVDHGTYPYVTSSNSTSGGACTGLGIGPTRINRVISVFKAYTTRVGKGPFPTELVEELGERLREVGVEFGATTGRKRRCGWFDVPMARRSIQINGTSDIALTKLDVLSGLDTILVCTGYTNDGEPVEGFPAGIPEMENVEPVYETFTGWNDDLSKTGSFEELPSKAQAYVLALEDYCETRISFVSVDPRREQLIARHE